MLNLKTLVICAVFVFILPSCHLISKDKHRNLSSINGKCKTLLKKAEAARDNLLPIVDELYTATAKHPTTKDTAHVTQIIEELYKNKNEYSQAKDRLAQARTQYQQAKRDPYPQNNLRLTRIKYYQAINEWNQSIDNLYDKIDELTKNNRSQGKEKSVPVLGVLHKIIAKLINGRNKIFEARNTAFHSGCYFV